MTEPLSAEDLAERIASVQWPDYLDAFQTTDADPLEIPYSFGSGRPEDLRDGSWTDVSGWGSYTAAEKVAVRAALDQYESLINVTFVESAAEAAVDLTFLKASQGVSGGRGRYQYTTWPEMDYDGFVLFNTNRDMSAEVNTRLLLHEIGHAFTLKHPGNYDVNPLNAPPGPYLPAAEDNYQFTLMSYSDNPSLGQAPDSLMLYDVAALQDRWGANMDTATGDDSYGLRDDGNLYVVWDAGGEDGITAAGTDAGAEIDLRPATFSSLSYRGRTDERIAVAPGAEIERATGSDHDDRLRGNALDNLLAGGAGDDTLTGASGDDLLQGGAGEDVAVVATAAARATLVRQESGLVLLETEAFGTDTLDGVEYVDFLDRRMDLSTLPLALPGEEIAGDGEDDTLEGSLRDDTVSGLNGADTILGRAGNDLLRGGKGADSLRGGDGDDVLRGQSHGDVLQGGRGRDNVKGGGGNDTLSGGSGDDFLKGGTRKDVVAGDAGDDRLFGNGFDDTLRGGAGNDRLNGGGDDDLLEGGSGDDIMKSGAGEDRFLFDIGHGHDQIIDFDVPRDTLLITAALADGRSVAELLEGAEVVARGLEITFGEDATLLLRGLPCACGMQTAIEII